jgi:hypothetical protein
VRRLRVIKRRRAVLKSESALREIEVADKKQTNPGVRPDMRIQKIAQRSVNSSEVAHKRHESQDEFVAPDRARDAYTQRKDDVERKPELHP